MWENYLQKSTDGNRDSYPWTRQSIEFGWDGRFRTPQSPYTPGISTDYVWKKRDSTPVTEPSLLAHSHTPPWMMNCKKKRINHNGSVVAHDNKVRFSRVESPLDSKNMIDSDVKVNSDILFGSNVKLMSLNIEGISMAKCDYLSRLLIKKDTDVLLLQETHIDAAAPPSRYQISGNRILTRIDHRQYGTKTYHRDSRLRWEFHHITRKIYIYQMCKLRILKD